jgi:hypothetical protein
MYSYQARSSCTLKKRGGFFPSFFLRGMSVSSYPLFHSYGQANATYLPSGSDSRPIVQPLILRLSDVTTVPQRATADLASARLSTGLARMAMIGIGILADTTLKRGE